MTIEINDLREQMKKTIAEPSSNSNEQARGMQQKMIQLETALKSMNDQKANDDSETATLKKKLTVFEGKMKQLEEEKQMRATADNADGLRDKLVIMEEKLAKMERRKSVSITQMMQQQMQKLEEELNAVRNQKGSDTKVAALEKKLLELQNTKVNPADVNDPETRALRSHIKKLEENMMASERKLEESRHKMEMERQLAQKKREEEEDNQRQRARQREEILLQKMAEMEKRFANQQKGGSPGGKAAPDDATAKRIADLEKKFQTGPDTHVNKQMEEMAKRMRETEARLENEKKTSAIFMEVLNQKQGGELESVSKDLTIAMLKQQTEELMRRLEEQSNRMENKFSVLSTQIENVAKMGPGPGSGAVIQKSGLSYKEIQDKMEEIQKKLFDPDIEERESEALNIEYEKLITELESTAEYKKEQEDVVKKWKEENNPLNNKALEKIRASLESLAPMKKAAALKRKPELKFIECTPDQIMKKHINDFKGLTTQNLTLEEARALYGVMPEFRKDQEAQLMFLGQLKDKIENEVKKPKEKAPPPIVAKKPVVFKKPPQGRPGAPGGDAGGDFLAELVKKRKVVG